MLAAVSWTPPLWGSNSCTGVAPLWGAAQTWAKSTIRVRVSRASTLEGTAAAAEAAVSSSSLIPNRSSIWESMFEQVSFKSVTNWGNDDTNINPNILMLDTKTNSGAQLFRQTAKPYEVALPKDPEGLRAAFRTFAVCWVFMRMRFPAKPQLRTASVVIDRYVEWLYGPKVWGLATLDASGTPISTPTILHVIAYDFQIRKKMSEFMNLGTDFSTALDQAKADGEIRQVHFLAPVSIAINTPECRACTAPNINNNNKKAKPTAEPNSATTLTPAQIKKLKADARAEGERAAANKNKRLALGNGSATGTDNSTLSARAKKRARQKANKDGAVPLALQNGGVGDGTSGTSSKGKGKGKGKENDRLPDGTQICFNWNRGAPCKATPCPFAHVCLICHKTDHPKCRHEA